MRPYFASCHDDVIKWNTFPRYWPFVRGIHRSQRPVTWCFDVFFVLCLRKRLSKKSRHRWFETPSRSIWRHYNTYLRHRTYHCCTNAASFSLLPPQSAMDGWCINRRTWRHDAFTHLGVKKMTDSLPTASSNIFISRKIFAFWFKFHCSLLTELNRGQLILNYVIGAAIPRKFPGRSLTKLI